MPDSDIAKTVAAIVALGLALQASLGPSIMQVTDALKAALNLPDGMGGLVAVITGILLGAGIGAVTAATTNANYWTSLGFGALAGVLVGAGAVKEYKAAGVTNITTSAAVNRAAIRASAIMEPFPSYTDYTNEQPAHLTDGVVGAEEETLNPPTAHEYTGQSVEVAPLDNLPDPTHDYQGNPSDIPSQADSGSTAQPNGQSDLASTTEDK
jgi:hypothetical protein